MIISSWSIRGFNDPIKQGEVKGYLHLNKIEVFGLLETRVLINNFDAISRQFPFYSILNNYSHHYKGRIWVFLNKGLLTLLSSRVHKQLIHVELLHHVSNKTVYVTFIYGSNDGSERESLWDELRQIAHTVSDWIILGDFNIVRAMEERIGPNPPSLTEMLAFNQCLLDTNLDDVQSFGCEHTWTNKRDVEARVWSKLDRVLTNPSWLVQYPHTQVTILPSGISDHSPLLVQIKEAYQIKKKFSYLNCLEEHKKYGNIVARAWEMSIRGNDIFRLFDKLKNVRKQLTELHKTNYSGLSIRDLDGPSIQESDWPQLCRPVDEMEIKKALFSIDSNKSPGQDGFSSQFFKTSWHIIKRDFCAAVTAFFRTGTMPPQANTTLLALIPKKLLVTSVLDFRPLACCTVFYKIVSKILYSRFKPLLPSIVGKEQGAFVEGRCVFENIMLTQSLIKGYGQKGISPRCLIKVDIKKAFDSLQWDFIGKMLQIFNFPPQFQKWLMGCITSTWFSIKIDGDCAGYFKGASGVRQGDPLSPFIFVLNMAILSRLLRKYHSKHQVSCHLKCGKIGLNHLIFVDDLMIFVKGDTPSVQAVADSLHSFAKMSGLEANPDKTNIYMVGIREDIRPYHSESWRSILIVRNDLIDRAGNLETTRRILSNYTKGGKLKLSLIYDQFREKAQKINWYRGVWQRAVLPKHSFIMVLAMQRRLATIDKLNQKGICLVNWCILCKAANEAHTHLFFKCSFTAAVWKGVLQWLGMPDRTLDMRRELRWIANSRVRRHWNAHWYTSCLNATVLVFGKKGI
ncbi:uncharacterized protein LOC141641355 [Silene latifolia]|uniref:uncharacterized protein LOC141641355 n=1 Tax=Silene latifolia TaxID=37657 RepID=UPI003D7846FB